MLNVNTIFWLMTDGFLTAKLDKMYNNFNIFKVMCCIENNYFINITQKCALNFSAKKNRCTKTHYLYLFSNSVLLIH